jgi:hypothetical protein
MSQREDVGVGFHASQHVGRDDAVDVGEYRPAYELDGKVPMRSSPIPVL